jgi:hypothetical protein
MWVALGLALLVMGLADAFYSVDATGHAHDHGIYDVAWVGGAALVAFASWEPHPGQLAPRRATGWPAIVLARPRPGLEKASDSDLLSAANSRDPPSERASGQPRPP